MHLWAELELLAACVEVAASAEELMCVLELALAEDGEDTTGRASVEELVGRRVHERRRMGPSRACFGAATAAAAA